MKIPFNLTVHPKVKAMARAIAVKRGQSVSGLVEELIRQEFGKRFGAPDPAELILEEELAKMAKEKADSEALKKKRLEG